MPSHAEAGSPVYLRPDHDMHGSVEHFWHFVFGYLLPAVDHIAAHRNENAIHIVESCGPAMDPVLVECLTALGAEFRIVSRAAIEAEYAGIPRIDLEHWDRYADDPAQREALRARIEGVVPHLRAVLPNNCPCDVAETVRGRILFLERSPMPAFYEPGGGAEVPLYGRARRHIENLSEACAHMAAHGHPVAIYEPGAHSLGCQSEVFAAARGVVAIRGAEFANLIWARPGTPVYMLTPAPWVHSTKRFQQSLCESLRLTFRERSCRADHPTLDLHDLDAFFDAMLPPLRRLLSRLRRTGRIGAWL